MNELTRQINEYKRACDEGREVSKSDVVWLLNELIAERDARKRIVERDKKERAS